MTKRNILIFIALVMSFLTVGAIAGRWALLAAQPTAGPAVLSAKPVSTKEDRIKAAVLREMSAWFKKQGETRKTEAYLRPYLEAAWRVSANVKDFPGNNRVENALKLFCQGAQESMFERNFVQTNIPGMRIAGPLKIRYFSLDYGWVGLNHGNVKWTYAAARSIQDGVKKSHSLQEIVGKKTRDWMEANITIPKNIKLKRIDPSDVKVVKHQYEKWKKSKEGRGKEPKYFVADTDFQEKTEDDLDSMLYYRVLVEVDRKARDWPWGYWHPKLYQRLRQVAAQEAAKP